ncbi:MAG: DUF4876 domain-containing protein [Bacteroidales bacterium]|nr:MAG: DUF4876 domain-containing protein [Bacteroidales bacterium]
MKKLFYFLAICSLIFVYSCSDDDDELSIATIAVQLNYPGDAESMEGVKVELKGGTAESFEANTDVSGIASFQVPYGIYEVSVTEDRVVDNVYAYQYTGSQTNINASSSELQVNVDLKENYLGRTDSKIEVTFKLTYPSGGEFSAKEGIEVSILNSSTNETLKASTTAEGSVEFVANPGTYQAMVIDRRVSNGNVYTYSITQSDIVFNESWDSATPVDLELTEAVSGQIIIKELYIGGCPKDDGSGYYGYDQYVILYNNSDETATLDNICLGTVSPYNSNVSGDYTVDGTLNYLNEGWVPAISAIPHTKSDVTIEPGEEMVIVLCGAIDHTSTYSKSVNLAKSDYWVLWDNKDQLTHKKYVAPDASIPSSQYLGIQKWGYGTGWVFSNSSPAFCIFTTKGSTPEAFGSSTDNLTAEEGDKGSKKLNTEWILDGIEVYRAGYENFKRFPDGIDSGSASFTARLGYTLYRNVDKAATEAIEGNADKLVYEYNFGTEIDGVSSTDPSEINAEASIAKGARIIYMDTNNSTNDFHQRSQASLRD